MLNMHEKIVRLEEEQRTTKEQLLKARAVCCGGCIKIDPVGLTIAQFIKNQDKLFREREDAARSSLPVRFLLALLPLFF